MDPSIVILPGQSRRDVCNAYAPIQRGQMPTGLGEVAAPGDAGGALTASGNTCDSNSSRLVLGSTVPYCDRAALRGQADRRVIVRAY